MLRSVLSASAALAAFVVPGTALFTSAAHATDGYHQHGYGVHARARAGAGVAFGTEGLSAALNPALIRDVPRGFEFGLTVFDPDRGYSATQPSGQGVGVFPGGYESGRSPFLIPYGAYVGEARDRWSWAIAVYGNGGIDTSYSGQEFPGPFGGGSTGVNLNQLFIQPTLAYEVTDRIDVGVGPVFAIQTFKAYGVGAFGQLGFSADPARLSDNGTDDSYGLGVRLGARMEVTDKLNIGVAYQPRINMSAFEDYAGLFASGGDFDIPWKVTIGASYDFTEDFRAYLDVREIGYSNIAAVGNPLASPGQLGNPGGPGFGWDDVTAVKAGFDWQVADAWTVRAGYAVNDNPVPESEVLFNILAPGVVEEHYSAGFTRDFGRGRWTLDAAVTYAPRTTVTGQNPLDPGQTISIYLEEVEATVGVSLRF